MREGNLSTGLFAAESACDFESRVPSREYAQEVAEWRLTWRHNQQTGRPQGALRIQRMKRFINEQRTLVCLLPTTWILEILSFQVRRFPRNTARDGGYPVHPALLLSHAVEISNTGTLCPIAFV